MADEKFINELYDLEEESSPLIEVNQERNKGKKRPKRVPKPENNDTIKS